MRAVSGDNLRAQIQSFQPDCEPLGRLGQESAGSSWDPGMGACGAALGPLGWESRAALGPLGRESMGGSRPPGTGVHGRLSGPWDGRLQGGSLAPGTGVRGRLSGPWDGGPQGSSLAPGTGVRGAAENRRPTLPLTTDVRRPPVLVPVLLRLLRIRHD